MIKELPAAELGARYARSLNFALQKYERAEVMKGFSLFKKYKPASQFCISYVFSDSIILCSHDASRESVARLLVYAFNLVRTLTIFGFPVRGGISYGDMYVDPGSSVFVGEALTNAYQLEARQEWIGVSISDDVVRAHPEIFDQKSEGGEWLSKLFVKYPVPMKGGGEQVLHAINWRWNIVAEKGTASLFKNSEDASAKVKLQNTLAFCKYLRANNLAYSVAAANRPMEMAAFFVADRDPSSGPVEHGDEF